MLKNKETLTFSVKLFHLFPAFKKLRDDECPSPKSGGENPHTFQP